MNAKKLNPVDVAEYYKNHSISDTAKFFHVANDRIQQLLVDNSVHIRSKAENNILKQQAYAKTCLKLYGIENPAKLATSREKMREAAYRQVKQVDEAAVIKYYLEPHSLVKTAAAFHISTARTKQILTEVNVLRTTEAIYNENKKTAINRINSKYQKLIPDIIKFYEDHTLNATKLKFNITINVLKRLLTSNGVELRSKEEDYAIARSARTAKYKETIRQKYLSIDKVAKTVLPEQQADFIFTLSDTALREVFLKLGDFIDNIYLEKYINLIMSNLDTIKQTHKTQSHHIIPRAYYKYHRLKVNNLDNNLVNLEYKNHILAHYYLALCTVGKLQECNAVAFSIMTNYEYLLTDNEITIISNLDMYAKLHEQASILNGKIKAKDNSKRIHIHKDNISKMIKQSELAAYLDDGWALGRVMHKTRARKVYCVELDQTFASITAASKQLNIHVNSIGICLRKQGDHYTAGGYHWKYVKD